MDIFILCSNYEGFGLVLLEAMQLRVPIIAANNSAIPEVLGFDYPGLFRTSDLESLIKVLNKFYYSRTKLNLNEIYRNNLSKFNPQKMERNLDNFYKSLNFYN
jgi:glycosyltransferase involved in cell wall biosynthesis